MFKDFGESTVEVELSLSLDDIADDISKRWAEDLAERLKDNVVWEILGNPERIIKWIDGTRSKDEILELLSGCYAELVESGYIKPQFRVYGPDAEKFGVKSGDCIGKVEQEASSYVVVPGMDCSIHFEVFGWRGN